MNGYLTHGAAADGEDEEDKLPTAWVVILKAVPSVAFRHGRGVATRAVEHDAPRRME